MTSQLDFIAATHESGSIRLRSFDSPQERKAAGIRQVMDNAGNDWKRYALERVKEMLLEREELTADDIREVVLIAPHHENAWGGLTNSLVKKGWITPADRKPRPSKRPEANGHLNPVYLSTLYRRTA